MKKPILILILVGALVYGNALFNGFVWDDEELIVNNVQIQSLANWPQFFAGSTFNSGGGANLAGLYYKPLMTVAFSVIYTIFGPNPFWFHLGQIFLHLANAALLFIILRRFFSPSISMGAALIFLVHPINAEAVVYLADYQEVLFFFFGALAFWFLLKSEKINIFLIASLFLASFLSKETGFVMVSIIVFYCWLFAREKLKGVLIALGSAFAIYAVLRFGVAGIYFNKHGLTPMSLADLPQRLLNVPAILFFYLKTFFWPADLTINQQWMIKSANFANFWLPLFVSVTFLASLVVLARRAGKVFLFFLLWFLAGKALHFQIFPLDLTVSDRWFYLPIVGLLGMGAIQFGRLGKLVKFGKYIFFLIVFLLALRTFIRTFDWRDGYTLYSHDVVASPEAFDLQNNLGVEIFRRGDFAKAKEHFWRSIELSPRWWTNWNNYGAVLEREKDFAGAKRAYETAIANGGYFLAYENLAQILLFHESTASAVLFSQNALKIFPNNSRLWQTYALANYFGRNFEEATAAARQSYLLSPSNQNSYIFYRLSQNLPLEQ